jgi:hypothetical protein
MAEAALPGTDGLVLLLPTTRPFYDHSPPRGFLEWD